MKKIAIFFVSTILFCSCMSEKFLEGADYDDIEAVYNSFSFITWRSSDKSNALIKLIQMGKTDEALLLIERNAFNLSYANKNNETALSVALQMEDTEVIASLINHGAPLDLNSPTLENPLFIAITAGNISNIDLLIQNGSNINSVNREENNVLHYAVTSKNSIEVIPYLLKKNVAIESKNSKGETPLFYAIKFGKIDSAEVLIQNGANVLTKDNLNQNLYFAGTISGSPATIDFVHKYISDINATNSFNKTPILVAIEKNDSKVLKQLIQLGADIEQQAFSTPLWYAYINSNDAVTGCLEVLVEHGVNINATDQNGQTVLIKSVINNSKPQVSFFVKSKAGLDLSDSNGAKAIHYAIQSQNTEILKILISAGADLLVKDKSGITLLHYCVDENNKDMIDILLASKRISVDYASSTGTTAAMQAYINSNGELANYLIQKGASLSAKDNKGKTLKTYRLNYYNEEISKANNQISTNNITVSVLQKDNITAQNRINSLKIELSTAQANLERLERDARESDRITRDIQREADRYQSDMNFYNNKVYEFTQLYNSYESAAAKNICQNSINEYKAKYNDAKRRYDERRNAALSASIESAAKAAAVAIATGVVSGIEKKIRDQNSNISSNNAKINSLTNENKQLLHNIAYYQQEISRY